MEAKGREIEERMLEKDREIEERIFEKDSELEHKIKEKDEEVAMRMKKYHEEMEDLKEHVRRLRLASKTSMSNRVQPSDVQQGTACCGCALVHLGTNPIVGCDLPQDRKILMLCRSLVEKSHDRLALAVDQSCTN